MEPLRGCVKFRKDIKLAEMDFRNDIITVKEPEGNLELSPEHLHSLISGPADIKRPPNQETNNFCLLLMRIKIIKTQKAVLGLT